MSTPDEDEDVAGLERRESTVARREVAARARERDVEADVLGIEGRCRVLQRQAMRLRAEGVAGAETLLLELPRVGPLPGVADRVRALEARRRALTDREQAVGAREAALTYLVSALSEAHARLEEVSAQAKALVERSSQPPRAALPPTPSEPGSERRCEPRNRLDVQITLNSADNFFSGFARDLSAGGLFISTFDLRPVGEAMAVRFSLPGGRVVECGAVVRWRREAQPDQPDIWPGMGLQFVDLEAEDATAIARFMALREPMFFIE